MPRKGINSATKAAVWNKTKGLCWYCGRFIDGDNTDCIGRELRPHIDHVVPVSKGGDYELGNLVLACQPCNGSKKDASVEEFRDRCAGRISYHLEMVIERAELHTNYFDSQSDAEVLLWLRRVLHWTETARRPFYFECMGKTSSDYCI